MKKTLTLASLFVFSIFSLAFTNLPNQEACKNKTIQTTLDYIRNNWSLVLPPPGEINNCFLPNIKSKKDVFITDVHFTTEENTSDPDKEFRLTTNYYFCYNTSVIANGEVKSEILRGKVTTKAYKLNDAYPCFIDDLSSVRNAIFPTP